MREQSASQAPRVLLTREQIATRIEQLGAQISRDFAGESVLLLAVLKGASIFLADLARSLSLDAQFEFVMAASYGGARHSQGTVSLLQSVAGPVEGRNVILVEDILDTGRTLNYLLRTLQPRNPRQLKVAVLLDKPARRERAVHADYVGFRIPNHFVVGYGMAFDERYRNLPEICILPMAGPPDPAG